MNTVQKLSSLISRARFEMWGKRFSSVFERDMFFAEKLLELGVRLPDEPDEEDEE